MEQNGEAERFGEFLLRPLPSKREDWTQYKAAHAKIKNEVEQSQADIKYAEWLKRMKLLASKIATLASYPEMLGKEQQRKEIMALIESLSKCPAP